MKRENGRLKSWIGFLCVGLLAGCGAGVEERTSGLEEMAVELGESDAAGQNQESQSDSEYGREERQLSAQELEWFTDFMNREENNGFLLSEYEEAGRVDLQEVLYNGAGIETEALSEEERQAYEAAGYTIETDITRLTTRQIEEFLQRKMGIGVGDMVRGLEWVYLKDYDIYVFQHGDTNFSYFVCAEGRETGEDSYEIHCKNDDEFVSDCVITLKKAGEDYLFVANRFVDKGYAMNGTAQEPGSAPGQEPGKDETAQQPEDSTAEETGEEPAKEPQDFGRLDEGIRKQLEIFAQAKDQWIYEDYDSFGFGYTVHDLDGDGRLELLTQIVAGTGLFSENHFYRINEAGDGIEELAQEYYVQYGELDIGFSGTEQVILRDKDSGVIYYLASDVTRNGYAEGGCMDGAYYLKDGCVRSVVYRGRYWLAQEDESLEETYYDEADNEISKEAWEQLYETFCADKEVVQDKISWINAYPEEARNAAVEDILEQLIQICRE